MRKKDCKSYNGHKCEYLIGNLCRDTGMPIAQIDWCGINQDLKSRKHHTTHARIKQRLNYMKKYKCKANELLYYLSTIVEANSIEEASEKYIEMIDNGEIPVNESELQDVIAEEVIYEEMYLLQE